MVSGMILMRKLNDAFEAAVGNGQMWGLARGGVY